jgi:hypothetical protein
MIYTSTSLTDSKVERLKFVEHVTLSDAKDKYNNTPSIISNIPLHCLVPRLFNETMRNIGTQHGMFFGTNKTKVEMKNLYKSHTGECCTDLVSIFVPYRKLSNSEKSRLKRTRKLKNNSPEIKADISEHAETLNQTTNQPDTDLPFPPLPPSDTLRRAIIADFCEATGPNHFQEAGCTVCGALTLQSDLLDVNCIDHKFNILGAEGLGFTRQERKTSTDPISECYGPVIDKDCHYICKSCKDAVSCGKVPKFALARGLWIGKVPEQLLIARVRHNRCIFRVAKGMHKMIANAVTFEHPMQKIYTVLPQPIQELDDVLAFIFTGPCQPTQEDFKRIPLLVRRNKVAHALEWLKLNHIDYSDLEISYKNLESYPEDSPPVVIDYQHSITNKIPEATSIHDMELENGTEEGACPFTVHTLTGEEYNTTDAETLKAIATKHLDDGGKVLAIGHMKEPQSIWKNPKLYPQMFPWLFPYGLGGISHECQKHRMSDAEHKHHLLMYHDKRFQMDPHFPLIAFNHEQIKDCTTSREWPG